MSVFQHELLFHFSKKSWSLQVIKTPIINIANYSHNNIAVISSKALLCQKIKTNQTFYDGIVFVPQWPAAWNIKKEYK